MTVETTYEPTDEQVTMILDDSVVLRVTLGSNQECIYNNAFKELRNDNPELYAVLDKFVKELFKLSGAV